MTYLNLIFSKTDNLILSKVFVEILQAHFYQCSEFKVGTILGLGDMYPHMTASKQKHINMKFIQTL